MPSGKRATHRLSADERKAAIVEAAVRLFSSNGFRGATTRELAAASGITEPVLYSHFATKRALYRAMIESICGTAEACCDPGLEKASEAGDDERYFTLLAEQMLAWYEEQPQVIRLLLFSALEGHELSDLFYERHIAVYYEMLTGYIRRRMREGAFRKMDPYHAARAFTGTITHQGVVMVVFKGRNLRGTRRQIARRMVSIFLNGIRKPGVT